MDFLFDTNIFLEIFLDQEKKEVCKKLLINHEGTIYISEFSVHSIGIILFKQGKYKYFDHFIKDILNNATIITIPTIQYFRLPIISQKYNLDFDDSMQLLIAFENNFGIITLDSDFKKVANDIMVKFI